METKLQLLEDCRLPDLSRTTPTNSSELPGFWYTREWIAPEFEATLTEPALPCLELRVHQHRE